MDATNYKSRSHEIRSADTLAEKGHDVVVCSERTPHYGAGEKPATMRNITVPLNEGYVSTSFFRAMGLDPDVVFCTSISGAGLARRLRDDFKVPVVVQVLDVPVWRLAHEQWREQWKGWVENLVLGSDLVIANTEETRGNIRAISGLPEEKVRRVYYGIDTVMADSIPEQEEEYQACFVSRLVFYKGVDLALYALSLLDSTSVPSNKPLRFVVVGGGDEAPRLIQTGQFTFPRVQFTGPISDREKWIQIKQSKFGIYPDYNRFITGQFPLEAVYAGKPCIAHDMPINHERLTDHLVYCNVFNTRELADKIQYVMDNLDAEKKKIAHVKEWIRENRSFRSHAEGVLKVLEEVA